MESTSTCIRYAKAKNAKTQENVVDPKKSDTNVSASSLRANSNNTVASVSDITMNNKNSVVIAPNINNNNNKEVSINFNSTSILSEVKVVAAATTLTEQNSFSPTLLIADIFGDIDKKSKANILCLERRVFQQQPRPKQTIDKCFNNHFNKFSSY